MKKVGILTFQFAHNYGAQLQAYALKHRVEQLGFETSVINYLPKGTWEAYSLNPWYAMKKMQLKKLLHAPKRMNQAQKFRQFQKEYLQLGKVVHTVDDSTTACYDALIAGSDQVWSDAIVRDVAPYFFRDVHDKQKLAYAGSFGKNQVSETVRNLIRSEMPEFTAISVREETAVELIQEVVPEMQAVAVCDPVFLLSANQWRKVYRSCDYQVPKEKFILYVDLRNDPKLVEKALKLGKEKNLPVYYVHPTCWNTLFSGIHQLYDVGPLQYLALMDAAEYIVTNSFHAMAFSCIFSKKAIHHAENGLGDRVHNLLDALEVGAEDEVINFAQHQDAKEKYIIRGERFLILLQESLRTEENDI